MYVLCLLARRPVGPLPQALVHQDRWTRWQRVPHQRPCRELRAIRPQDFSGRRAGEPPSHPALHPPFSVCACLLAPRRGSLARRVDADFSMWRVCSSRCVCVCVWCVGVWVGVRAYVCAQAAKEVENLYLVITQDLRHVVGASLSALGQKLVYKHLAPCFARLYLPHGARMTEHRMDIVVEGLNTVLVVRLPSPPRARSRPVMHTIRATPAAAPCRRAACGRTWRSARSSPW